MIGWLVWAGLSQAACPLDPAALATGITVDDDVASHSARPGKLVGTACLYSTGAMAKKVLEEGSRWSYAGSLVEVTLTNENPISCPYTSWDGNYNIVATELLETVVSCGLGNSSLNFQGRSLEVDGVRYVVLTSFRVPQESTPPAEAAPRPSP